MSVIGIITVPKKRKSYAAMLFNRVYIKERFGENPSYVVAELSAAADDVAVMKKRKLNKLIKKAENILRSAGAGVVLADENLRVCIPDGLIKTNERSSQIPKQSIFDAFWTAFDKCSEGRCFRWAYIIDKDLSVVTYEKISEICGYVRNITLKSDMLREAEEIAERIFAEYGVWVKTEEENCDNLVKKPQIVIDADTCRVRVGDFIIDGAEFVSGSRDYRLDAAEEAAYLGEKNNLKIKNWISGKNIIKIS